MTYQFDQLHRTVVEEEEPSYEEEEVRVLSQRLSHLCAKSDHERRPSIDVKRQRPSSSDPNPKKVRVDADHLPGPERIPTYLSTACLASLNIDMPSHWSIEGSSTARLLSTSTGRASHRRKNYGRVIGSVGRVFGANHRFRVILTFGPIMSNH